MSCPPQIPRIPWTPAEDAELKRAVAVHGDKRWSQISTYLPGRTSKACSHRWRTYLQPGVMHASSVPFSDWEQAVVKEAHKAVGNNWAVIARMLPGRTNAAVKNFWYSYRRRWGKAQGKRHGADGNPPSDDITDSEEGEEDLGSGEEMECDEGCDEGYCEDDDMGAAGYTADHTHTMEGVDCSASWQVAAAGMNSTNGGAASSAAAAAGAAGAGWIKQEPDAGWLKHEPNTTQGPADTAGPFQPPAAFQNPSRTPDINHWHMQARAAAAEMHGSCGGAGSSRQQGQGLDPLHQQQHMLHMAQQQQQQHQQFQQEYLLHSWSPRRSSHHSWSGAPRSLPAAAAAGGGHMELGFNPNSPGGCAAWDLQLQGAVVGGGDAAAGRFDNMPGALAGGVSGEAEGVPFRRVSMPRVSNHGHFLEPQQLAARASSRFISSSNQLFERHTDVPLPFGELHARQVTTSYTAPAPAHSEHAQAAWEAAGQAQQKPLRFALDLSAIDESETDSEPAPVTAAAAGATGLAAAGGHVSAGLESQNRADAADAAAVICGGVAGPGTYRLGSECMVSSAAAGSSGHSTGGQQEWSLELHQIHGLLDAAMQHMHVQQQQQPGSAPHPAQQYLGGEQQVGGQGLQPPCKLVRPSLCSDAGSKPQQHARSAAHQQQTGTTPAPPPPGPGAVAEDLAGKLHGFMERHMQQYAAQPQPSSEAGAALCGSKRKFVLDLSDP